MDTIDLKIISELTKDAETPFSKIARKIGISPQTVLRRWERMESDRVILCATTALDLSKIGYNGKAFLRITNAPNQEKKTTVEALKQIKDIFMITEIIGDFDVFAIAVIRDLNSAIDIVDSVRELPSVENVEASFSSEATVPVGKAYNTLFKKDNWKTKTF